MSFLSRGLITAPLKVEGTIKEEREAIIKRAEGVLISDRAP